MHSETFRIPDDIPPSLRILAEQFCSDAFQVRGVTQHTLRLEVCKRPTGHPLVRILNCDSIIAA